ncbi:hypothetical protein OL229_13020 [Neisseriaceae bacterium JH1-16]|nr:hypothetical protein [Neisseriaceae bacterium JH1-16]
MNAKQKKWLAIGGLLLVLGAVKIWFIAHYLLDKPAQAAEPPQALACASPTAGCVLPGGGSLRFTTPPSYRQPFELTLSGVAAKEAPSIEFSMAQMDMGFNRYRLVANGQGGWHASVRLPVCASGGRDWIATINLDGRLYTLPLRVG